VILIIGLDALQGLGTQVVGQLACLVGAMLYAGAAIHGKRFNNLPAVTTATGTMICATVTLIPLALIVEQPWTIKPSAEAIAAITALSIFCTGVALLIYFRLVRTIGSMGVASQSYLRAGVGVILGMVFLNETITLSTAAGIAAAMIGVALINWPARKLAPNS
jgi:drug/metabolite transporter (DMT)-like permease